MIKFESLDIGGMNDSYFGVWRIGKYDVDVGFTVFGDGVVAWF
jgi:hypothetical protein